MFIATGFLKRTPLRVPQQRDGVRPASSKIREALMSMLAASLEDAVIWDLFAGSGSVGLEALSRGARRAVFFEHCSSSLRVLEENIRGARRRHPELAATVVRHNLLSAHNPPAAAGSADVLFADPPYRMTVRWLRSFAANSLWWPRAELVIKAAYKDSALLLQQLQRHEAFEDIKERRYGSSLVIRCSRVEEDV